MSVSLVRTVMRIVGCVLLGLLAILALLILLWSLVCFLGGPEGRIGSSESFAFGGVYLLVGGGLMALSVFGLRRMRSVWANRVTCKCENAGVIDNE